jgi:hypothetical protein
MARNAIYIGVIPQGRGFPYHVGDEVSPGVYRMEPVGHAGPDFDAEEFGPSFIWEPTDEEWADALDLVGLHDEAVKVRPPSTADLSTAKYQMELIAAEAERSNIPTGVEVKHLRMWIAALERAGVK